MSATCSMLHRQLLLTALYTPDNFVPLDMLYAALAYRTPLVNSSGTTVDEPTVGDYARVPIPLDSDHWIVTSFGEAVTLTDTVFPTPSVDWGLLISWVLLDSPIGGGILSAGSLVVPTYFVAGQDPPILGAGLIVTGLYD